MSSLMPEAGSPKPSLSRIQHAEQLVDRSPRHRVDPIRGDFGERFQHEAPLAEARVRHDEPWLVEDVHPVENQIQVERPRRIRIGALAPELPLGLEQRLEERARRGPSPPPPRR